MALNSRFFLKLVQYQSRLNHKIQPFVVALGGPFHSYSTHTFYLIILGDIPDLDDKGVIIINTSQYTRYRSVLKRVQGVEKNWMHNSLVVSLGGFTTPTRKTHILYCREIFDYAELEEHPYLCNHLGKNYHTIRPNPF